jgi:hypothetical protein
VAALINASDFKGSEVLTDAIRRVGEAPVSTDAVVVAIETARGRKDS